MKIIMQYPIIEENTLCDGETHTIEPISISQFTVNGVELYALEYNDETHQCECETILVKDGARFFKVPLRNYDDYFAQVADGIIKPQKVDLSILDGVQFIDTNSPIADIASIKPRVSKPSESELRARNGMVELLIDEQGNIYIPGYSAQAILGFGGTSQFIMITQSQLELILSQCNATWARYGTYGAAKAITLQEVAQRLAKQGLAAQKINEILGRKTIYIVIQNAEDEHIKTGVYGKNSWLGGMPGFTYDSGVFKKVENVGDTPLIHFQNVTYNFEENEMHDINKIPPIQDNNYYYEFVGGFELFPTCIDEITPLKPGASLKETLSDAMLGNEDSKCRSTGGVWLDDGLQHFTFNLKEIRGSRAPRTQLRT